MCECLRSMQAVREDFELMCSNALVFNGIMSKCGREAKRMFLGSNNIIVICLCLFLTFVEEYRIGFIACKHRM